MWRKALRWRLPRYGGTLALLWVGLVAAAPCAALGRITRYELTTQSRLLTVENGSTQADEPLSGSFSLAFLPLAEGVRVEAVTGVDWSSPSIRITGSGFLLRREERAELVIDARVGRERVLLRSVATPDFERARIRLVLEGASARRAADFRILLDAVPAAGQLEPTPPGSEAPCASRADAGGPDEDGDGVGDDCDRCPATAAGDPVSGDGCSPRQLCPCGGPVEGGVWSNHREYVRCVAGAVRRLRREGRAERRRLREILRNAVLSACGRRVIARVGAGPQGRCAPQRYPCVDCTALSVRPFR